jgi:hypothetical protein
MVVMMVPDGGDDGTRCKDGDDLLIGDGSCQ